MFIKLEGLDATDGVVGLVKIPSAALGSGANAREHQDVQQIFFVFSAGLAEDLMDLVVVVSDVRSLKSLSVRRLANPLQTS